MGADALAWIPFPPLLVAVCLALGISLGRVRGEASERYTSRLALLGMGISLLLITLTIVAKLAGGFPDQKVLGLWFASGDYRVHFSYRLDWLSVSVAALVGMIGVLTLRFSRDYMHREAGYHRFFLIMSLFLGAMLLLVTAGNALLCFAGWELAGVCSYLLIAYAYDRPNAAAHATRVFLTNRVGDAGFIAGIFLTQIWAGTLEWDGVFDRVSQLPSWQIELIAAGFLVAALAKSAQLPFAPWLARAIEGPTPSSALFYGAVMVHAGVFLVLRMEPVFAKAPLAMDLMVILGGATALYGWLAGLSQTDVKSALVFSTCAQIGLMFAEAGWGWWPLAWWHLGAHAGLRAYQFLTAPSLMHLTLGLSPRPVPAWLNRHRWLYLASLQRLWVEPATDRLFKAPIENFAADLQVFDAQFVEPAFGLPASDQARHPNAAREHAVLAASGIAGAATLTLANGLHWFEEKLVLQGVGQNLLQIGRRLGRRLNRMEALLAHPRYLVALIVVTLMFVL